MTKIAIPVGVALIVIALGTYVQGRMMDRWGNNHSQQLVQFGENLARVPMNVGNWEGEDLEGDEEQLRAARVTGSVTREFKNPSTGEAVSMFLVCGKSQHVADHTPDRCYTAAGFTLLTGPHKYDIDYGDGDSAELYTAVFQKEEPERTHYLRVFWTWRSTSGGWHAPKWPLLSFAGTPALYKLYLISAIRPSGEVIEEGAPVKFAKRLFPVLDAALFSDGEVDSISTVEHDEYDAADEPMSEALVEEDGFDVSEPDVDEAGEPAVP